MTNTVETDRIRGRESIVTIACCQCEPKVGHPRQNLDKSVNLIEQAVKEGANFIILPELSNSGYVFNDIQEARELSEEIPSGKSFQTWSKLARDNDIYIVAGYNERDGKHLFNSSVLIGPYGHIGTHRKVHLWYEEKLWFEPGNLGLKVFETPIGKIGMHICYDQWFCEVSRIQAMQGADLIAVSTNWVPLNETEDPAKLEDSGAAPMANAVTIVNAHINKVWVAASDRVGEERGQPFLGRSIIVGPIGLTVAGPASAVNEEILIARDCNLLESRARKNINDYNVLHGDRRTDLYDALLGYER